MTIIRSLLKEEGLKRTAIDEVNDLNTLFIDDLISSFISYEEDLVIENENGDKKKKIIASKASRVESDEESEFKDEVITIITRKFRGFLRNQVNRGSSKTSRIIKGGKKQLFVLSARSLIILNMNIHFSINSRRRLW